MAGAESLDDVKNVLAGESDELIEQAWQGKWHYDSESSKRLGLDELDSVSGSADRGWKEMFARPPANPAAGVAPTTDASFGMSPTTTSGFTARMAMSMNGITPAITVEDVAISRLNARDNNSASPL